MLTKTETEICARLGMSVHAFARAKRARKLGLSTNVAGSPYATGGRGRQTIDEAAEAMRTSGKLPSHKDLTVGADALLADAEEALAAARQAHDADPESDGVWQNAAKAAAFIEEALERTAPAYANRGIPAADDDDEDAEGAARNPFSSPNSLKRRVGAAIQQIAGPMLRAVGGAGIAAVTRPLTTVELAICHQLGQTPEDFRAAKARRASGKS